MDENEFAFFSKSSEPNAVQNSFPKFQISAPVSIRPSQFMANETKTETSMAQSETESMQITKFNSSKIPRPSCVYTKSHENTENSVFVIEDTVNQSTSSKTINTLNNTRKEFATSPFKNHYGTNTRLNETLNAQKDIDPFNNQLQNAFLDDIDFIEYIKPLENVFIETRLRPIEAGSDLILDNKTFQIERKIGQGSFGFVYR